MVFWVGGSQDRVADPVSGVELEEVTLPLDALVALSPPLAAESIPPPQPAVSSSMPREAARRRVGCHIVLAGCLIASMPN